MKITTKTLLYLMLLATVDTVIPFPITAGVLLYVLVNKPEWFKKLVAEVYAS